MTAAIAGVLMIDRTQHRFVTLKCVHCGFLYDVPMSCGDRLCPICNRRRYGVLINRYEKFFAGLGPGACRFVTVTLKHNPDTDLGRQHWRLGKCVHKLIEYGKKHWGWVGGVVAYQATNKGNGWNDHCHFIVQGGNFVEQEVLSKVWLSITGDSYVVGIRYVLNPLDDLAYLLGYTLSVDGVWAEFKEEYNKVFKGRRLLQSWGTWFNRMAAKDDDVEQEFLCPNCGESVWVSDMQGYDFYLLGARPLFAPMGSSP